MHQNFAKKISASAGTWGWLSRDACSQKLLRFKINTCFLTSVKQFSSAVPINKASDLAKIAPTNNEGFQRASGDQKQFRKLTEEDHAKLITAKLKRLSGLEKIQFFEAVCKMGRANSFHFNIMISSKSDPKDGDILVERMEKMKILPDLITFTSLIDLEVVSLFRCVLKRLTSQCTAGQVRYAGQC